MRNWKMASSPHFWILLILMAAVIITGCSGSNAGGSQKDLNMAPLTDMPAEVKSAPIPVQQAYQFAIANPEVLEQIPCYCGCGNMGHASNYACYASGEKSSDTFTYDTHALGCSICVDITLDTMRLLKQGKTVPEIRGYVDSTYAKYGPSNMP